MISSMFCSLLCILLLGDGVNSFLPQARPYAKWPSTQRDSPCRLHSTQSAFENNEETPPDPARMRVKHIKAELDSYGVSYDDCFEKEPLVRRLIQARANGGRSGNVITRQPSQQRQQHATEPGGVGMTEEEFWRSVEQNPQSQTRQSRRDDDDFWKSVKAKVKRQTPGGNNGNDFFRSVQQPTPTTRPSPQVQTQFFGAVEDGWGSVAPQGPNTNMNNAQPKQKPKTQFFGEDGWGSVAPQGVNTNINIEQPIKQPKLQTQTEFFGAVEDGWGSVAPQGANINMNNVQPKAQPKTQFFGAVRSESPTKNGGRLEQPKRQSQGQETVGAGESNYRVSADPGSQPRKTVSSDDFWNVAAKVNQQSSRTAGGGDSSASVQQPTSTRAPRQPTGESWASTSSPGQTTRDGWASPPPSRTNDAGAAWESSVSPSQSASSYNQQSSRQDDNANGPGAIDMTEEEFWRSVEQSAQQRQAPRVRSDNDAFWKAVTAKVKRQAPSDMGGRDFFSSMQQPTPTRARQSQTQFFGGSPQDPWASPSQQSQSNSPQQPRRGINMSEEDFWRSQNMDTNGGGNNAGYSGGMSPDGLL